MSIYLIFIELNINTSQMSDMWDPIVDEVYAAESCPYFSLVIHN